MHSEELALHLNPSVEGVFRITEHNFGPSGHVVQVPWRLTLSNTGSQTLSVTERTITTGGSAGSTWYTGIDGGMFQSDQKPVELPIKLEPGESRAFIVLVGVLVPPKVLAALSSLDDPKSRTVSAATRALGKEGLDLYGNQVSYREYGGGAIFEVRREQNAPTFWYQVKTGRGKEFVTSAASYTEPR